MNQKLGIGIIIGMVLTILFGASAYNNKKKKTQIDFTRFAMLDIEIIDDDEDDWFGQRGRAELYLKIYSTFNPKLSQLVPLNLDGCNTQGIQTNFLLQKEDTLKFELLDYDEISKEEEKFIQDAIKQGQTLLINGVNLFCYGGKEVIPNNIDILDQNGKCLIYLFGSDRRYKTYGSAEYNMHQDELETTQGANYLTLVDGKKARLRMKIYFRK